jgi:transposase
LLASRRRQRGHLLAMGAPVTPEARRAIQLELECGTRYKQIAVQHRISVRQVERMARNLRLFGAVWVDPKTYRKLGRPREISAEQEDGLISFILENKAAHQFEMVQFLQEEYDVVVSQPTVSRYLKKLRLTCKKLEREACARDDDLRRYHVGMIAQYDYRYLVYVDESASNERTLDRKRGWSPAGRPCRVRSPFGRSKRWSILPAITADDGYIACEIYHGSFNAERFNNFIVNQVLPQMRPFPAPRSILVMDNCSTHKTLALKDACEAAGIKLVFLPPYSPDLNPIELSFSSLKAWLRRNYQLAVAFGDDFESFLSLATDNFMRQRTAHGWFRKAWIHIPDAVYCPTIEELWALDSELAEECWQDDVDDVDGDEL